MALGNRMTALVACFFVVALTSGNYAFSVYSGALKHSLTLTQDDLDSIAQARRSGTVAAASMQHELRLQREALGLAHNWRWASMHGHG